jgi:TPR repeat protein
LLGGRFELRGELGRGGMGVVHRALDRALGREVALKVVQQGFADAESRVRFVREGQLTAALRHPNIVAVHSAGELEGRPFIAYELVAGARPLDRALATLDLPARVAMLRDVARALGHAHAHGVVHRDVKPANVLVDEAGRPRVSDFGLATAAGLGKLTQTGEVLGTPNYMSPEQLSGQHAVGPPTDVWALGVVLYRALTDEPPFVGTSFFQLAGRVLGGEPPRPPRSINPATPRAVEAACLACLRRDPADRPPDGEALARLLDEALRAGDAPAGGRAALALAAGAAAVTLAAGAWFATRPSPGVADVSAVTTTARAATVRTPPKVAAAPAAATPQPVAPARRAYAPPVPASLSREEREALDSGDHMRVLAVQRLYDHEESDPRVRAYVLWRATATDPKLFVPLGKLLEEGGRNLPADPAAALQMFEKAAAAGSQEGLRLAAERLHPEPATVRGLGPAEQAFVLGQAFADPARAERDRERAGFWLGRAASLGHVEAGRRLDELVARGELDSSAALAPLLGPLIDGNSEGPEGQAALAQAHREGRGVPRDLILAADLYERAATEGHADAALQLGQMLLAGEGRPRDPVAAARWLGQAAEAGLPLAWWHLAQAHEREGDVSKALECYRRGADAGHEPSRARARELAPGD